VRYPFVSQRLEPLMAMTTAEDLTVLAGYAERGELEPCIDWRFTLAEVPNAVWYPERWRTRGKALVNILP